jgi:hypothetical protein
MVNLRGEKDACHFDGFFTAHQDLTNPNLPPPLTNDSPLPLTGQHISVPF